MATGTRDGLVSCGSGRLVRSPTFATLDALRPDGHHGSAEHEERRVAPLHGGPDREPVFPARSNQRLQLQQARGGVAVQDRQLRTVPGVQARGHAAHGQGRAVHHGRYAPLRDRARPANWRAHLDAQRPRGQARRDVTASALGPRRRLLDRRPRRRAHPVHDDRLPARLAQREDRPADQLVRHERHRRSEDRCRQRD